MSAEPKRILIVDDNPDVNEFIAWILLNKGYEVASACNGIEAMKLLSCGNFDVVLLDMVMPAMGGLAVINEIRQAGVSLPIIVLSGHVGCLDVDRIKSLGANLVLSKPAEPREILNAVQQVTGQVTGVVGG